MKIKVPKYYNVRHKINIGRGVSLANTLFDCGEQITIGRDAFFGHNCMVLTGSHDYTKVYKDRKNAATYKPIIIKRGAWIGSGAIILQGVTIGKHAVVGAGSVVTKDVPANEVWFGNPAKFHKKIEFGNKQKDLWDGLAKKNAKYYINSDKGKKISDVEFTESGYLDTNRLIERDRLIDKNGKFLEIGCGIGRMTEFISRIIDDVYGCDISKEMIDQARIRLEGIEGIDFCESDGHLLPYYSERFITVFSYLVFQHMKTKEMVESNFREVYRVLKPGGIFKVRIRTDKVKSMDPWWAGVSYSEAEINTMAFRIGFKLIDTKAVEDYGLWMWLKK